jgi:hypothetical protein
MTTEVDDEAMPQETAEMTLVPMNKLAKVYRKMQSRIQQLTTEYETQVEVIKAQQDVIKIALKDQMLKMGLKSAPTTEGTVVLSTKTRYNTQDWDSFKTFVLQNEAVDLLEKRIAQTNMAQFLEENPNLVPPGLNSMTEYTISVRKPTN